MFFHFIYLRVVWEFTHVNSMKDMIYIFGENAIPMKQAAFWRETLNS
jgi:hypothetical protein